MRTEAYRRCRDVLIRPQDLLREGGAEGGAEEDGREGRAPGWRGDDGTARGDSTAASLLAPGHPMFDTPLRDWVKKHRGGASPGGRSFEVDGATPGPIDGRWWEPERGGDEDG